VIRNLPKTGKGLKVGDSLISLKNSRTGETEDLLFDKKNYMNRIMGEGWHSPDFFRNAIEVRCVATQEDNAFTERKMYKKKCN
jgi:hypothetical protein